MSTPAKNAPRGLVRPVNAKRGPMLGFARSAPPTPIVGAREQVCAGDGGSGRGRLFAVEVPAAFRPLYQPARYKVYWGGRGAAKSWAFADAFVTLGVSGRYRFLCARELQVSIADSVHKLLADRIEARGLGEFFRVTDTSITSATGSEYIFRGLRNNVAEIKSLEGVDYVWVEEAQKVRRQSWELLIPTIRKEGSEIWLSFNPDLETDDTYQRFVVNPPDDAVVVKVTYRDNPWFSATLEAERAYAERTLEPEDYAHIWEGEPRRKSAAQVFGGRWEVRSFATPESVRLFYGADWGFADDPTVLVRCWVQDNTLYVDYEAWAQRATIDQIPLLFDQVPGVRRDVIRGDASRPEIHAHLRPRGYVVRPCKKWPGSIQDGIDVMRSFERIVVHPRCVHTAEEMRLYAYKVDSVTDEVLPVLVDKYNHCIDALRYALEPVIRGKVERR